MGLSGHRQQEGWRRFGVLLLAFLQLAVVGAVPVADAALELATADDTIHVEAQGSDSCDAPHDHIVCQLCRILALTGAEAPERGALVPPQPELALLALGRPHSIAPAPHSWGGLGPRAPPIG